MIVLILLITNFFGFSETKSIYMTEINTNSETQKETSKVMSHIWKNTKNHLNSISYKNGGKSKKEHTRRIREASGISNFQPDFVS